METRLISNLQSPSLLPELMQLSTKTKFIYGLGDWGTAAAAAARNAFWFVFLTNVVGLNAGVAGTVVLVGKLWDGINDPLVGMLSDRIQTRWGRRRPFLLFGAVPFGLSFFLLFYIPPLSSTGLAVYYALAFLLSDTIFTIVNVPYVALTPELSEDYDERSSLAGWRMSISILASLVTVGSFKLLAENVIGVWFGGGPAGIRLGYMVVAAVWGATMVVPLLLLFRHITEPERPRDHDPIRPLQTMREVFQNRPFRIGAIIYLFSFTAADIILVVFVRFLIDYIRVAPGIDSLVLAIVLGVAFMTMPLVVRLTREYGKRRTYMGSMIFLSTVMVVMSQVPPGGQKWVLIAAVFAGLGYGAANVIPWAIVADVTESDELHSGKRREGIYAGYLVFMRKLASAVAIFIVGQVLSATGFISSTTGSQFIEQPPAALLALRIFIGYVPAVLLLLAVWAASRYPLSRERHAAIRQQLAAQRRNR
ncbi:MAG: MFS transporter [Ardenticatenaceae bacterium]|nr:MFS transporter [Ardenticatenaceae bacterium]